MKSQRLCLCKVFYPICFTNRITARFPYSWRHTKDGCIYKVSTFWMIYSVTLSIIYALVCWYFAKDLTFNFSNMPEFVNSLTNILALGYTSTFLLQLLNKDTLYDLVAGLNKIDKNNPCQKSRKLTWEFQVGMISLNFLAFLIQNAMFIMANYVFGMEIPLNVLVYRNLLILPLMKFTSWLTTIRYLMSMFICFENTFVNYLGYRNIHPCEEVTFTHNFYDFAGFSFTNRKACDENHVLPVNLQHLSRTQIIDYLRITHESMYSTFLLVQKLSNPLMLIYTLYELVILIVVWYSIALNLYYDFQNPTVKVMCLFNLLYAVLHGLGILWFLKILHTMNIIVQGLRPLIVTCALNAKSEEQQQFRIFARKVVSQKQFEMCGLFTVDMRILGPVVGSVITYVSVALQLGVPPQENN